MNAQEFEEKMGRPPIQDDLDRVNCLKKGEIGHTRCGWCEKCDRPNWLCICIPERKNEQHS